jgi:mannose-1-phosphate guanylyltransferase/mannose-6-phosphate isomerase
LSRELYPKQLLPLVGKGTMLQETLARLAGVKALGTPIVVCNESHRFLVAEQLHQMKGPDDQPVGPILLEPVGRNTAPAVAMAALTAERAQGDSKIDPILLILPADHVIRDVQAFQSAIALGQQAAQKGKLVTFGVVARTPETGYGYIRRSAGSGPEYAVEQFVEKPDLDTAKKYVASGQYYWNSGMFMFTAKTYLREIARHAPRILAACEAAVADAERDRDFLRLGGSFASCPSDSIDYAVAEKTDRAVVIELDAAWSDVGSWSALYDVLAKDDAGNVLRGNVLVDDCRNSYISADTRIVAAIGVDGVVIVATADAVLVMSREHAQRVKNVADALAAKPR